MNKFGIVIIAGLAILAMAMMAASENSVSSNEGTSQVIKLPEPRTDGGFAVEKALDELRSIRAFGN